MTIHRMPPRNREITGEFVEYLRAMGVSADLVAFAEKHRTDKPPPERWWVKARRALLGQR